jgi:hypothetical protein
LRSRQEKKNGNNQELKKISERKKFARVKVTRQCFELLRMIFYLPSRIARVLTVTTGSKKASLYGTGAQNEMTLAITSLQRSKDGGVELREICRGTLL